MGVRLSPAPLRGLPYINGLIVVNDAETGLPQAIMDAGESTAARTAAASRACLRALGPAGWRDVALLGFGEQGRYHAKVVEALNPQARLHIYDPRVYAYQGHYYAVHLTASGTYLHQNSRADTYAGDAHVHL